MTTTTETTTGRIALDDLLNRYVEVIVKVGEVGRPTVYRAEIEGVPWLTNKHWLLPESRFVVAPGWPIKEMPGHILDLPAGYVTQLREGALSPSTPWFDATYAGVLTEAGYSAYNIAGTDMAALVDAAGERVGVLAPHRRQGETSVRLPASREFLDLAARLRALGIARDWQCWEFAALLTSAPAAAGVVAGS